MRSVISREHTAKAMSRWLCFISLLALNSFAATADEGLRTEGRPLPDADSDVADADLKHYVQAFDQAVPLWQTYGKSATRSLINGTCKAI